MKKLFKKGLVALTLMLGMAFAVPQSTCAKDINKLDLNDGSGRYVVYSYAGPELVMKVLYDRNGNEIKRWYVRITPTKNTR